jgi:cation diffusion facilitator CzcD-associated flavoprotein CzcO
MKFGHECVEARWKEDISKWEVKLLNLAAGEIIEDTADVFMTGLGNLNKWKLPDIKGLLDFQGEVLHTANWKASFDPSVCNYLFRLERCANQVV